MNFLTQDGYLRDGVASTLIDVDARNRKIDTLDTRDFGILGNGDHASESALWSQMASEATEGAVIRIAPPASEHSFEHTDAVPIVFPAGVTIKGSGGGRNGTVLRSPNGKPLFKVDGDSTSTSAGGGFEDFHVVCDVDSPVGYGVGSGLIQRKLSTDFGFERVSASLTGKARLLELDACFLWHVKDCRNLRMNRYGAALWAHNASSLGLQMDTVTLNDVAVLGVFGLMFQRLPGSSSDFHAIHTHNYKQWVGATDPSWGQDVSAFLTSGCDAGATTLSVGSRTGGDFQTGDPVLICGNSTSFELNVIADASVPGTVTLTYPTQWDHGVGELLLAHGFRACLSTNMFDTRWSGHTEKMARGVILHGGSKHHFDDDYDGNGNVVTMFGTAACEIDNVETAGTNVSASTSAALSGGESTIPVNTSFSGAGLATRFPPSSTFVLDPTGVNPETLTVDHLVDVNTLAIVGTVAHAHSSGVTLQGRQVNNIVRIPPVPAVSVNLTADAAAGQAVLTMGADARKFAGGQAITVGAGGTAEGKTVLSVDPVAGTVTVTSNLANLQASGTAVTNARPSATYRQRRAPASPSGAPSVSRLDDSAGLIADSFQRWEDAPGQVGENWPAGSSGAAAWQLYLSNVLTRQRRADGRESWYSGGTEVYLDSPSPGVLRAGGSRFRPGSGTSGDILQGNGTPENVFAAGRGSVYMRLDAPTPDKAVYIKTVDSLSGDATKGWRAVLSFLTAEAATDPPNIPAGDFWTTTITVQDATKAMTARASFSTIVAGVLIFAVVTASDTVTVTFWNTTSADVDMASGTLRAEVSYR